MTTEAQNMDDDGDEVAPMVERHPDQARRGWDILRHTIKPDWLAQPAGDFSVFAESGHKATALLYQPRAEAAHGYDKRAMYVGAASSVKLGAGSPLYHHQPALSDAAGLWHIRVERGPETRYAASLPPIVKREESWQYAPVVQLLVKLGFLVTPLEAYLFPSQHQTLRPFYEHVKRLLDHAPNDQVRQEVKLLYTVTFGSLARKPKAEGKGYLYRPDWWYTLVAHANTIMYRHILQVWEAEGIAPVRVQTDELGYAQPVRSLPLGDGIGQFRHEQKEAV